MRAYKLQGKIDDSGKLIVSGAIDLPAGEVEIILLQPTFRTSDCNIKSYKRESGLTEYKYSGISP